MISAPRIDTIDNRITATTKLLHLAHQELADLHVLAYDRYISRKEIVVKGGQKDYALDDHGDLRARDAFKALGIACTTACDLLDEAAQDVLDLMRERADGQRGTRSIAIEELAAAIEAQARRAARAEYVPIRREPQPEAELAARVVDRLRHERDNAIREADRLAKRLARYEPQPVRGSRRRRRIRT